MKNHRKAALALLMGIAVTGTVGAAAASFNGFDSDSLGSGDSVVASCDTDGIAIEYTTAYDTANAEYEVTAVTFTGVSDDCDTLDWSATLVDGAGDVLEDELGLVSLSSNSFSWTLADAVEADQVEGISLVISG
jgi:hypothetical protein